MLFVLFVLFLILLCSSLAVLPDSALAFQLFALDFVADTVIAMVNARCRHNVFVATSVDYLFLVVSNCSRLVL